MTKVAFTAALGALLAAGSLAVPAASAAETKPRSAESIACSKEADAKGLHGKPRKAFRKTCIKAATKGKAGAT